MCLIPSFSIYDTRRGSRSALLCIHDDKLIGLLSSFFILFSFYFFHFFALSVHNIHLLLTHVFFIASPNDCEPKFNWASLSPNPSVRKATVRRIWISKLSKIIGFFPHYSVMHCPRQTNRWINRWMAGWMDRKMVGWMDDKIAQMEEKPSDVG